MPPQGSVLLTGATGLLGHYLLRDLLLSGRRVAVLARDSRQRRVADRVAELVAFWGESLGRKLPMPTVLEGELGSTRLELGIADRGWLKRHRPAVVHAAANLSFRPSADGEPWKTNVAGTRALLDLCRDVGLSEWHHVSTAFVCGRRQGNIRETDLACDQGFHNPYEEAKFTAETLVRESRAVRATVYRPTVIVGDSRTGYTRGYSGFYRFVELGARLADVINPLPPDFHLGLADPPCPRVLSLRMPMTGDELFNLVPVDWVSRAIVELLGRPPWHGNTFHLVSRTPVSARLVQEIGSEVLHLRGIRWAGTAEIGDANTIEEMFRDGLKEYWPYLNGTPEFKDTNTAAALPRLPPPTVDGAFLRRLIRFAMADGWGRRVTRSNGRFQIGLHDTSPCVRYVEQIFPRQARRSPLAREAGLDIVISLDVCGPGGGQWTCQWVQGELIHVKKGLQADVEVTYHTDTDSFQAIIEGRETPQQAFFEQKITLTGNLEAGLKLAYLFDRFLDENAHATHVERN